VLVEDSTIVAVGPEVGEHADAAVSDLAAAAPRWGSGSRSVGRRRPAGRMEAISNSTPSRHPVTVTQLLLVRCAVCRRTVAHQPGHASAVLTKHYEKAHPETVGGD